MSKLRHVLVGAGAVGVAYGWYLAKGGGEVAFLVRPKYADALRAGTRVYFPKKRGVREPVPFAARATPGTAGLSAGDGYAVLTDNDQVLAFAPDVAWLCVSSTALRGPWLEPFLATLPAHATLVMLQPGAEDRAYLAARFPSERIVSGLIALVAWQSPLPHEPEHPEGIAIWWPPMGKLPFKGPRDRAQVAMDALAAGGAAVRYEGEKVDGGPLAGGVLTTHVAALEGVGWTFAALRQSPLRKVAARAAREAIGVLASLRGKKPPFARALVRPWVVGTALRIAAWRMPFDFEVYLGYHFTKVRDQTAFALSELVRLGRAAGLPVDAIEELIAAVFAAEPVEPAA